MAITRGTTPTIILKEPNVDVSDFKDIFVTFKQGSQTIFTKVLSKGEMDVDEHHIYIPLTQEETLRFSKGVVMMHVKVLSHNGNVAAANIVKERVDEALLTEVISDG